MIFFITAIAGAYGAHIMRAILVKDRTNLPHLILAGAFAGGVAGQILSVSNLALLEKLNAAIGTYNLGLIIAHLAIALIAGGAACLIAIRAERITAS